MNLLKHTKWVQLFALILCFAMTVGCDKKLPNRDIGPQVSADEINIMVEKRLNQMNPYTIQLNQSTHKLESQEVITSGGVIRSYTKEWTTDVTELEEKKGDVLVTTLKMVHEKENGEFIYEVKNVYAFPQLQTRSLLEQLEKNDEGMENLVSELQQKAAEKEVTIVGVAYHNLKEKNVSVIPPPLVKNTKDCKGIPNCRINAYHITHDIVFLLSNGKTQTHNVEWVISAEVPFFAGVLKQCTSSLVPVNQVRVLVKQCREVVNF